MLSSFKRSSRDKEKKDKGYKSRVSSTSSIVSTGGSAGSFSAPSKVIQALYPYAGQKRGELSFDEGQFFYVNGEFDQSSQWTQASDPVKNISGVVPTAYFKVFEKTHKPSVRISGSSNNSDGTASRSSNSIDSPAAPKKVTPLPSLYGRLLYDFEAQRADELNCEIGDSLIICAHHEYEWFIGKFLDKIGEPGLVPVSYVQLFDIITKAPLKDSAKEIIDREGLPKVEEWKAMKNKHKASARAVGSAAVEQQQRQHQQQLQSRSRYSYYIQSANVETFSFTNEKYWFLVRVVLSNGAVRNLCRFYEDFFNFQQVILSTWPREAGRYGNKERIIPYIPGPLPAVSDVVCHQRLSDLGQYLNELLELDNYISRSDLVLSFFDLREGDREFDQYSEIVPVAPLRAPPDMVVYNGPEVSQPIDTRHSQYQHDRISQYENVKPSLSNRMSSLSFQRQSSVTSASSSVKYGNNNSNGSSGNNISNISNQYSNDIPSRSGSRKNPASQVQQETTQKLKLKFYYKDDIFAIVVPENCSLDELKRNVIPRIDESEEPDIEDRIKIFPKNNQNVDQYDYQNVDEIVSSAQLWKSPNFTDKGKLLVVIG